MDYTDDNCMNVSDDRKRLWYQWTLSEEVPVLNKDIYRYLFASDAEIKIENSCGAPVASWQT
jgi:hypothetical protein